MNTESSTSSKSDITITTLHSDIIQSHILNRLDGPTLASAASTASYFRILCTEHHLWRNICTATWPSLTDPTAAAVITTFPAGHRSIFSDSFPSLHYSHPPRLNQKSTPPPPPPPEQIISAVDIFYKGKPVFSRVIRTETQKGWFLCSPLWVELLDPKEVVPTPLKFAAQHEMDEFLKHLEENLTLSWIVIDPTRTRAANLSSHRPVTARRHWLTSGIEILYAVSMDSVQWVVKVSCAGKVGGAMHVREVSLTMEDTEGRHLMGKDSIVILQHAMENGKRVKLDPNEARERFEKFCVAKRDNRDKKTRKDLAMDMLAMFVAFTVFALLFWFMAFGF